jgi:hypothetical protein
MIQVHLARPLGSLLGIGLMTLLAVPAAAGSANVQAQAPRPAAPAPPAAAARAAKPYVMTVKNEDGFINVALKARQAKVTDIAKELGPKLKARIDVGPGVAQDTVTVDLPSSPLETVLQMIAPRVLIDYEVRQDARPLPLVIHLLGPTDVEPTANIVQRGASQGLVISGHTEETPTDDGSDPVTVSGDVHQLSIKARNQPLSLVAMVLGDTLGITVDMTYAANELVLVNVTSLPAEDAVLSVSPNLGLHVRVDVSRAERTPIKLVLRQPGPQAAR